MERMGPLYRLDMWAATLAGFALFMMMAIGTADVVSTKAFGKPVPGTYELTETFMVASAFLAMALAQAENSHIRVEILVNRLPERLRGIVDAFGQLCTAVLFSLVAWFGWSAAIHSFTVGEFSSGALPMPLWPARFALALGASLMVVQSAAYVIRDAKRLRAAPNSGDHEEL